MSKQLEIFKKIFHMYLSDVRSSDRLITDDLVISIEIPESEAEHVFHGTIYSNNISVRDMIEKVFPNAKILLTDKYYIHIQNPSP